MILATEKDELIPQPGLLFVLRDEQPHRQGLIELPEGYYKNIKSAMGTVVTVGEGVSSVKPGDRVILGAGIGRHFSFVDDRAKEVERWYVVREGALIAIIKDEASDSIFRFPPRSVGPQNWTKTEMDYRDGMADSGETVKRAV